MTADQTKFYTTACSRCARTLLIPLLIIVAACGEPPWNNPHPPSPDGLVTYQSAMSPAPPKHLDPALSYASDESLFIMQVYEPPLDYHFLKRPYELIPGCACVLAAGDLPGCQRQEVQEGNESVAFTRIHPAFTRRSALPTAPGVCTRRCGAAPLPV